MLQKINFKAQIIGVFLKNRPILSLKYAYRTFNNHYTFCCFFTLLQIIKTLLLFKKVY